MKIKKQYHLDDFIGQESTLEETYGKNKQIPDSIKLATLVALSHFPELKDANIRFVFQKSDLAYASRPTWKTLMKPKEEWEYLIILSTCSSKVPKQLLFTNLPFNAQIGILGHELSHTAYYLDKSCTDILSIAIKYLNWNYRIKFENATDEATIRRGLGWQLLEFALYCRQHPSARTKFISWLNKFYLSPSQIIKLIDSSV